MCVPPMDVTDILEDIDLDSHDDLENSDNKEGNDEDCIDEHTIPSPQSIKTGRTNENHYKCCTASWMAG